jgi:hypothetical protein
VQLFEPAKGACPQFFVLYSFPKEVGCRDTYQPQSDYENDVHLVLLTFEAGFAEIKPFIQVDFLFIFLFCRNSMALGASPMCVYYLDWL